MKKLQYIFLTLASCMGLAVGQTEELKDYILPIPDRFVEFADETLNDRGQDLHRVFQMSGVNIGAGAKIEINRAAGHLVARLPRTEALKVIELLNLCITRSTARFFRPCVPLDPASAEANAKAEIPIPQAFAEQKEISIHEVDRDGDHIICLLVNPADHPIWYNGAYRIQVLRDGKWKEYEIVWDFDTPGANPTQQLLPHRARSVKVQMPDIGSPVRIGLSLLDDVSIQLPHNTVWSDPINLK